MTPLPFAQRGAWRRYTTADGLAAQQTEHIAEYGDGCLWIATVTGGVSRFDGDEFRTYTTRDGLPADGVYSLLIDRCGQLWCGTSRGLCLFDGDRFHPFTGDGRVAGAWATFLFEDRRGWVWLKGFEVCGYWDGERYCDLAPCIKALTNSELGSCWGICEDEAGAIWMAGHRHTIRWAEGSLESVALPQGPQLAQEWEPCLAAHPEGGIWHSDGNRIGIWREGGYTAAAAKFDGFVRKILSDRQGRTWFCLSGGEPAALVCEGGCFRGLSGLEIGCDRVNGFHEDREGSLWFATWGGGVSRFDPSGPFTLGIADGLPSPHIACLTQDREHRLWIAFADLYLSGSMFGYLQDGHFCVVDKHCEGGLLVRADGSVWLAGVWGLRRVRDGLPDTEYLVMTNSIRPERGNANFTCLAEDEQGLLLGWRCGGWPQTELGICRCDGAAVQELFAMAAPEVFSAVVDLIPTADGLWFGVGAYYGQGPGYGLGFLAGDGAVSWYLPADGLVHESVEALHLDRAGHLWAATLGGVSRFDGRAFSNYTTDNGLPHNHVRSITEDDEGGLWFGTDAGVARFDGETFQLLRWGAGSPIRSMARDSTGQWWFATMEGLVGYRPSAVPPRVRMVQTLADRVYRGSEAVEVNTSVRQLVFEYKGMSFRTRAEDMRYRCRLLGHEEGWRPATSERRVFYRDLPPGDYTFQVRAMDRDLNESAPARGGGASGAGPGRGQAHRPGGGSAVAVLVREEGGAAGWGDVHADLVEDPRAGLERERMATRQLERRHAMRALACLLHLAALALLAGQAAHGQDEPLFVSAVLTPPHSFTLGIEGPACSADGTLYAVNYARQGTIGKVSPAGVCSVFVELPKGSIGNGIRFDSKGYMLIADYTGHNLLQVDMQTRQIRVLVHEPRMHQPNDLAIGADDRVYASDPDWGNSTGQVWRIDPDGTVALLETDMGTTNGIEVGPDEKTLYVNESAQRRVWAYDLSPGGEISNKRLLVEFSDFGLDGMRCDVDGNLYITRYGKGTVAKVSPAGQVLLEVALLGWTPSNLAFGGPDGRTCYVTLADQGDIETFRVDRPGRSWQLFQQRQTQVAPSTWGQVKQDQR